MATNNSVNTYITPTSGQILAPGQCMFSARLSANTATNVTGDGTKYQVICDTVIFDQSSNYNNSTGVFTAPVTGKYLLIWNVGIFNLLSTHTVQISYISTTARNYVLYNQAFSANPFSQASWPGSAIVTMAATDTAIFKIYVAGATKTVGVTGGTVFAAGDAVTFCCGYLLD